MQRKNAVMCLDLHSMFLALDSVSCRLSHSPLPELFSVSAIRAHCSAHTPLYCAPEQYMYTCTCTCTRTPIQRTYGHFFSGGQISGRTRSVWHGLYVYTNTCTPMYTGARAYQWGIRSPCGMMYIYTCTCTCTVHDYAGA